MSESGKEGLAGKVALVTGGGRGIGRAISLQLARDGAHVVVNYSRSSSAAEEVVQEIADSGGSAEALQFDVASSEAVNAAVKDIVGRHGGIYALVNNAGIASDSLLVRTKDEDWHRTIEVNLSGAFFCARAVAKPMMKAREGRIINISSVIGQMGNAGQAAYAASKAGIFGLTKSLAMELASRQVTANAIAPGYITTDMTDSLDEELKKGILDKIPANTLGETSDVAQAVSFLSSGGARYITGQIIGINGGMYM